RRAQRRGERGRRASGEGGGTSGSGDCGDCVGRQRRARGFLAVYQPGTLSSALSSDPDVRLLNSLGFVIKAPIIVLVLFVINVLTFSGEWWVRWPALFIGIAWVLAVIRVLRAIVLLGGLAGLV